MPARLVMLATRPVPLFAAKGEVAAGGGRGEPGRLLQLACRGPARTQLFTQLLLLAPQRVQLRLEQTRLPRDGYGGVGRVTGTVGWDEAGLVSVGTPPAVLANNTPAEWVRHPQCWRTVHQLSGYAARRAGEKYAARERWSRGEEARLLADLANLGEGRGEAKLRILQVGARGLEFL